jgi:hypothetical protein
MTYFNELTVDLGDDEYFPSVIYERTRENPNDVLASPCRICDDSLDRYADQLLDELFSGLGI